MTDTTQNEFFRFGFSITAVIFAFDGEKIKVLLIKRTKEPHTGEYALPSTLINLDDEVNASVDKMIYNLVGKNLYRRQLRSFFDPERHPLGRVVTIPYYALANMIYDAIPIADTDGFVEGAWYDVDDLPALAFDHAKIIGAAHQRLCVRIPYQKMGQHLLPVQFTVNHLHVLHECLLKSELDKRNFSKKTISIMELVKATDDVVQQYAGRPATLYVFNPDYKENQE